MARLLVRLAGPSCLLHHDRTKRRADVPSDIDEAVRAFKLQSRRSPSDPAVLRLEDGISVYSVADETEADDLVEERAAFTYLDDELPKPTDEKYLLLTEEAVEAAGLVIEVVEDRTAATQRLCVQHREIRLRAGVSNADVPIDDLKAALRRLATEVLSLNDLEAQVRRVDKQRIKARIAVEQAKDGTRGGGFPR